MARPSSLAKGVVLVTGADGFTGRYVAEELRREGYDVVGTSHVHEDPARHVHRVDLLDRDGLASLVSRVKPRAVVHLAAIAFVAHDDVDLIYRTNVVGSRNLLSALCAAPLRPEVVVLASSANVYGDAGEQVISEETSFNPANDYAVSKMAMEYMARLWMNELRIVIARPFNYTGVGQDKQFLVPKIVDHYRRRSPTIELGNIDVVRDFLDVRDVARFYRLLIEDSQAKGIYNLCSGRGYSLREILEILSILAGYRIDTIVNPDFIRKNEIRSLVGGRSRMNDLIGEPGPRPLEETLTWMYTA